MFERFTEPARRVVFFARYEASRYGSREIETEHLLLGMFHADKVLVRRWLRSPATIESIQKQIEAQATHRESISTSVDLPLSHQSKRVLAYAAEESERLGHKHIGPEHLMIGLLREEKSLAASLLMQHDLTVSQIRAALQQPAAETESLSPSRPDDPAPVSESCRDLTATALAGEFRVLIGREREIENIIQVLGRRHGSSPALIGEPGVGKTAIVGGLAQRIADNRVPAFLADKRILALDTAILMSDARTRRQLERKFTVLIDDIAGQSDVILSIDGLFEPPASGSSGALYDVLGVLLAALSLGRVQCIATGTPSGYRRAVQRDPAVERYLRAVEIAPPDEKTTVQILMMIKEDYEKYHEVKYDDASIEVAVLASIQFMPHRYLPEKAIDLMDEGAVRVRLRHAKEPGSKIVTKQDIEELVSERTGLAIEAVRSRLKK